MFGGKITTSLILAFLALAMPVMAITVGPLHGKEVQSLKPLGQPAGIASEELTDLSFPKELEAWGDLPSAAMEWQRIAYKSFGPDREKGFAEAARLHIAMEQPQVANTLLGKLMEENPASPFIPQALYQVAQSGNKAIAAKAFQTLQTAYPQNEWTHVAQMQNVWAQAESGGKITQTYKLPQAEELKKRINGLRLLQRQKVAIAGAVSVLMPGLGHMYAGHVPEGVAVLIFWALFTLAFLSACRHRHYAYAFLFVIPAVSLWLTGPNVAMKLVDDQTERNIATSLTKWNDLRPTLPTAAQM